MDKSVFVTMNVTQVVVWSTFAVALIGSLISFLPSIRRMIGNKIQQA
jgi:hypothetical protein